jgi:hypothetical protein
MRVVLAAAVALAPLALGGASPAAAETDAGFPFTACTSVSFDPPASVILGFRCAASDALADAFNAGTARNPAGATYNICHGEQLATCRMHAEYDVFEQCTDANGIGTALPASSARRLCPDPQKYDVLVDAAGTAGDNCGYAWFHLHCD